MQLRLMDLLADPDNPNHWPLKLKVFKSKTMKRKSKPHPHDSTGLLCKYYCKKFDKYLVSDPMGENEKPLPRDKLNEITDLKTCYECIETEIVDGVLYYEEEGEFKYFFIDREIPVMYPLELRHEKMEKAFINRYKDECEEMGITKPYSEVN